MRASATRPVEVAAEVFRIESEINGRPLYQFVLRGEVVVLIDTGISTTPHDAIFPALESLDIGPAGLDLVVVTHSDADHHGGNAAIKRAFPRAFLSCGLDDRRLIEQPRALVSERYQAYQRTHEVGLSDETAAAVLELCGEARPVDLCWTGGEMLRIGPEWELRILHTPGHSPGHISIHDLRANSLLTGDAVHGRYYPGVDGSRLMAPNYIEVEPYLQTIEALAALEADSLHGAHWPAMRGADVASFLRESRQYVLELDAAVRRALDASAVPLSLRELTHVVNLEMSRWPEESLDNLVYSLDAHLKRLVSAGSATHELRGAVSAYRASA
jgi:glyoxylase-like metal-dependent hydrolase (beta-lactamase superfamily II)